ncbi:hypothetical protein CYMTET_34853 [Cymbomonas tetramitiformis]|uniref:MORN repeat-containing protein 3 n=1 Tax=Cymbomonas tetramitiformis TaxID=36881 RepID=A0AAE0KPG2_9CHLO|nr:hypothetical protein CYMTET_34853 [Cymbomonas tetramitiformis]
MDDTEQELPVEPLWHTWDKNADKEGERCTVFWIDGHRYQGEWHSNKRHGKGTQYQKNGDKYEGNWIEDRRCGQGTFWKYEEGKYRVQYNGEWKDDQRHGFGTYYNKKGDFYRGEWKQGQRHGKGRQTYGGHPPDGFGGDIYDGEWYHNQRHGKGVLSMANGDVYQGDWAGDLKHGPGTFFYESSQKRYDGVWKEGQPVSGCYTDIKQPPGPNPNAPKLPVLELLDSRAVERAANHTAMDQL